MRVLVVDDDDDVRTIARLSLSRLGGMTVLEARSGREAVGLAARERPDVVLLDVMMPELDGAGTLAALRAAEETRGIPVVFLTAKALPAEVERLKSLGAVDVLTKPFEPRELAAQLRTAVAGR